MIESGIEDPIAYIDNEVRQLNLKAKYLEDKDKIKQIGDESPEKQLEHFLLKSINDSLGVKKHIDFFQNVYDFYFNAYDVLPSLECQHLFGSLS